MDNKTIKDYVIGLVDGAIGGKYAITFKSKSDFEIFLEYVNNYCPNIDALQIGIWEVFGDKTTIVIREHGMMYYGSKDYYVNISKIDIVNFDTSNIEVDTKKASEDSLIRKTIRNLIRGALTRGHAISFGCKDDFRMFMSIVDRYYDNLEALDVETWKYYGENTTINIENGVIYYADEAYYTSYEIEVVEFNINKILNKKEDVKMGNKVVNKKELDGLIKVLLESHLMGEPRALIVKTQEDFDIINNHHHIKGSWEAFKEDTCISLIGEELSVVSYTQLKKFDKDILFAIFNTDAPGLISFEGISEEAYDNILKKRNGESSKRDMTDKSIGEALDELPDHLFEPSLDALLTHVGELLTSDIGVNRKLNHVEALVATLDEINEELGRKTRE